MARGITQEQVNDAIEQLVLDGERPTIERVRRALGTGSPNTLTRMLDAWWQELGQRLAASRRSAEIPNAPAPVIDAASRLWEAALAAAGQAAEASLRGARQALADEETALSMERQAHVTALAAAESARNDAEQARREAETRLQDLQRLADQLAAQVADLQDRLGAAQSVTAELAHRRQEAEDALRASQVQATQERKDREAAHRAAEDRWLTEVDQLRRERVRLSRELQQVTNSAASLSQAAQEHRTALTMQLAAAEKREAANGAKASALEAQVDRLNEQLKVRLGRGAGLGTRKSGPPGRAKKKPPTKAYKSNT